MLVQHLQGCECAPITNHRLHWWFVCSSPSDLPALGMRDSGDQTQKAEGLQYHNCERISQLLDSAVTDPDGVKHIGALSLTDHQFAGIQLDAVRIGKGV